MATATPRTREVTRTVIEKVTDGITLELSQEEAQYLRDIIGKMGGRAIEALGGTSQLNSGIWRALTPHTLKCDSHTTLTVEYY